MQKSLDKLLHASAADAKSTARLRLYPATGRYEIMAANRPIFGSGWEAASPPPSRREPGEADKGDGDDRARRRARRRIHDLALSNVFDYFVTLTLDGEQINRYDPDAVGAKLRRWLSNQVQRKGLRYILVPELHKDGAIHFHGFINAALPMVDSGTLSGVPGKAKPVKPRSAAQRARWLDAGAHPVYNLPGWSLGFTTAIKLYGSYPAAVAYVCKYIGKDSRKIGGRWFYHGGDLAEPVDMPVDASVEEIAAIDGAYLAQIPAACLSLAMVQGELGESDLLDSLKY